MGGRRSHARRARHRRTHRIMHALRAVPRLARSSGAHSPRRPARAPRRRQLCVTAHNNTNNNTHAKNARRTGCIREAEDDDTKPVAAFGRRAGLVTSLSVAVLSVAPPPAVHAAGQPIDWVFSGGGGGSDASIGDALRASLAESGIQMRERPAPEEVKTTDGGEGEGEGGTVVMERDGSESERGPPSIDEKGDGGSDSLATTALKFGKLGAILVFADVVTFFIMGRSVLGIMDDGGEEGWKEKMADKIMERAKEKNPEMFAKEESTEPGATEEGEDDPSPPSTP